MMNASSKRSSSRRRRCFARPCWTYTYSSNASGHHRVGCGNHGLFHRGEPRSRRRLVKTFPTSPARAMIGKMICSTSHHRVTKQPVISTGQDEEITAFEALMFITLPFELFINAGGPPFLFNITRDSWSRIFLDASKGHLMCVQDACATCLRSADTTVGCGGGVTPVGKAS
ncbi:unnamed protein product [Ectocarpus sp. 12 AP-2014]